jgi:hypothetical protein
VTPHYNDALVLLPKSTCGEIKKYLWRNKAVLMVHTHFA